MNNENKILGLLYQDLNMFTSNLEHTNQIELKNKKLIKPEFIYKEEGDSCSVETCSGILEIAYIEGESCSCFINPPCYRCTHSFLKCNICGEEYMNDN